MLKKINDQWFRLIGSPQEFSLESRIFHSISVGLIILGAAYVPYNFFIGLYVGSVSAFVISAIFSYQYYHSRVRRKAYSSILFGFTGLVIFGLNYFTNSGIDGSTDLIWPAHLLLVIAIAPYRQQIWWLVTYIFCFFILHVIEFYYPYLIQHPFTAGRGQFIDRVTAFPIPVVAVYIIIKFMRKNYDKEKIAAEDKAIAIEIRNEQISLQKDQLQQSNAEKNKLMSIISHDLRAPLIHIQSYLQLLNANELDDEQRPIFEGHLLTATNNTVEMLSNLLQWSKSQMEGPSVHLMPMNLLAAAKSTLEMGRIQAEKKSITLNYNINPEITVTADADMLQLVVRNLISNAIKFTPPDGVINIAAQTIQQECKITISDNGKGMDEAQQQRLFSVNTQPSFGTNNEKGVGLGLLLCKEFIERQGGRIGFESVAGQGSSFFVFVPLAG